MSFGQNDTKPKAPHDEKGQPDLTDVANKTTINLITTTAQQMDAKRTLVVGIILAVLIVLFAKFAIIDPLAQVSAKEGTLSQERATLSKVETELKDYDQVEGEYESYSASNSSGISADEVLTLVDTQIASQATVTSVTFDTDTVTVILDNASLDTVGSIAQSLGQQSIVSNTSVSTASSTSTDGTVTATLVITLTQSTGTTTAAGSNAATTASMTSKTEG